MRDKLTQEERAAAIRQLDNLIERAGQQLGSLKSIRRSVARYWDRYQLRIWLGQIDENLPNILSTDDGTDALITLEAICDAKVEDPLERAFRRSARRRRLQSPFRLPAAPARARDGRS